MGNFVFETNILLRVSRLGVFTRGDHTQYKLVFTHWCFGGQNFTRTIYTRRTSFVLFMGVGEGVVGRDFFTRQGTWVLGTCTERGVTS